MTERPQPVRATQGPLARYHADLQAGTISYDPGQEAVVLELQRLYEALLAQPSAGWGQRLRSALGLATPAQPVRGLYLWGGVGRGKTYLMDCFYDSLPFPHKQRTHFHRFMSNLHAELKQMAHQSDPLRLIAKRLASEVRVLCFDEFFVSDITDAMLLGTLLEALFADDVTLVATSNVPPAELYKNGLQRERFLPAIAQIEQYTHVVHMPDGQDFRLRTLHSAPVYYTPLNEAAERHLLQRFRQLAPQAQVRPAQLQVLDRPIATRAMTDNIVWFDFAALCDGPRSQQDYLEIARCFQTVIVSGVPILDPTLENQARRFINLIDVFYDRNIKLIISAAAPPTALYRGDRLAFEFQRTASRLLEMQSEEYLARKPQA